MEKKMPREKTTTIEKLPLRSTQAIRGGGVDNVSVLGRTEKAAGILSSVLRPAALQAF